MLHNSQIPQHIYSTLITFWIRENSQGQLWQTYLVKAAVLPDKMDFLWKTWLQDSLQGDSIG